jgi:PHP family Zn ribbon phosphoesterase
VIYFADLHIHSRFSRATSPTGNLVELARWAALKGILVLATGDFTHPEWRRDIRDPRRG